MVGESEYKWKRREDKRKERNQKRWKNERRSFEWRKNLWTVAGVKVKNKRENQVAKIKEQKWKDSGKERFSMKKKEGKGMKNVDMCR